MAASLRCSFLTPLVVLAVVVFASIAQAEPTKASDRAAARALAEARAHADAPRWKEVAAISLEIALQVPGTETGRDAIQLYIEALSYLQRENNQPMEIYDQLANATPHLVAGYCRPDDIATHPEPCGTLVRIQLDLQTVGDGIPINPAPVKTPRERQAIALHEGESLVKLWNDIGKTLCIAKNAACPRIVIKLDVAAYYFRAAHQVGRAMEIRRELLNPQYGQQKTCAAQRTLFDGAQDLEQSLLDFDEAAIWYERLARESPSHENAREALVRAVRLRLLLSDEPAAKSDVELFERQFGMLFRPTAGRLALSIAEHAVRAGNWADAETWLETKRTLFDHIHETDVLVLYHAYQARIAVEKGRPEQAFAQYGVVRHLWKNAPIAGKSVDAHPDVDSFAKVLDAVGEAEFFFAKRSERPVDEIQFPSYHGPIEEKPLLQYLLERRKLEIKKLKAIEHAAEEYENVLYIEPVAPPRWIIAAATRVGDLWAAFADDVENIPKLTGPIPGRGGITYEELRKAYEGSVGSSPWRARAQDAFKFCVQQAIRSRHFDENARHCERWLSRHERSPRRVVDELHDTPSHAAFGIQRGLIESDP